MSIKKKVIDKIIEIEGGYVNDPDDSGGETKFGITSSTAYAYGYKGEIKNLTREIAYEIYSKSFWDAQRLTEVEALSPMIAEKLADIGVNMHPYYAGTYLQRSLNISNYKEKIYRDIKVDGYIGKKTLKSLEKYLAHRGKTGEEVLLGMLTILQGAKYIYLAEKRVKDEKFVFGWFANRIVEPIKRFIKEAQNGDRLG